VVIQQMSRLAGAAPGGGPFIETYIAPDMHLRPIVWRLYLADGALAFEQDRMGVDQIRFLRATGARGALCRKAEG
jgi:cyclopropane-fatty-acyl-phospholipid synthase